MICRKCGAGNQEGSRYCSTCGENLYAPYSQNSDIPATGLNILSFFIPLVGLILYIVWNNTFPKKAQACGKWALIGFVLSIIFYFITIFGSVCAATSLLDTYY